MSEHGTAPQGHGRSQRVHADHRHQQPGASDATAATVFGPLSVEGSPPIQPGGDELLGADAAFALEDSLIRDFDQQPADTPTPDGRGLGDRTWSRVRFDMCWRRTALDRRYWPARSTSKPASVGRCSGPLTGIMSWGQADITTTRSISARIRTRSPGRLTGASNDSEPS